MMSVTLVIIMMAVMGAVGGLVNCALSGEFHLPHLDAKAKTWRPGWVGNVLLGAVAAAVTWGIYGPFALYDFFAINPVELHLTLAQLLSSLAVGISGGRILTVESQRTMIRNQRDEEREARIVVNESLKAARRKLKTYENSPKPEAGKSAGAKD